MNWENFSIDAETDCRIDDNPYTGIRSFALSQQMHALANYLIFF